MTLTGRICSFWRRCRAFFDDFFKGNLFVDVSEDFNTGFSAACFCAVYGVLPLGVSMTGLVIGISASSALAQPIPLGKGCLMSLWHPQQAFAQLVAFFAVSMPLPWALVQSLHPPALVHMHLSMDVSGPSWAQASPVCAC